MLLNSNLEIFESRFTVEKGHGGIWTHGLRFTKPSL